MCHSQTDSLETSEHAPGSAAAKWISSFDEREIASGGSNQGIASCHDAAVGLDSSYNCCDYRC